MLYARVANVTRIPAFVAAVLLLVLPALAGAAPIRLIDAVQPGTPATGWAFLWNSGGAIGNPGNYTSLLPTTHASVYYDVDGINGLPAAGPGAYAFIGVAGGEYVGLAAGHPGRGTAQTGAGGFDRYVIAAYTLSAAGEVSIVDSILTNADFSTNGLDLKVFLNDNPTPVVSSTTTTGKNSTTTFDAGLGALSVGDVIYVAVGPRGADFSDTFAFGYTIDLVPTEVDPPQPVPEPGTMTLVGLGLGASLWRRRTRQ